MNINDLDLRDYFAVRSPAPTKDWIQMQQQFDRNRNPHNDSYKPRLREEIELDCIWRYKWADMMIKVRTQK